MHGLLKVNFLFGFVLSPTIHGRFSVLNLLLKRRAPLNECQVAVQQLLLPQHQFIEMLSILLRNISQLVYSRVLPFNRSAIRFDQLLLLVNLTGCHQLFPLLFAYTFC